MGVGDEAGADRGRSVAVVGCNDGSRTDSRRRRDLRHAGRVDDGGGVDSRHPDADLVLLEEIGDELVEIDIRLGVVEVGELVVITEDVSMMNKTVNMSDLRLVLSIEDLHRQLVVSGLLSSETLGLGLSTLLLT